jgi:hypothetical protein
MDRTDIFVSYSHEDRQWLKILRRYFKPLEDNDHVAIFDDTHIQPSEHWRNEITAALQRAKIAILLVTQSFLISDFITREELPNILKAEEHRGLLIFWIAIKSSTYKGSPIEHFQAANNPNKPLNSLPGPNRERELVEIAQRLKHAVDYRSRGGARRSNNLDAHGAYSAGPKSLRPAANSSDCSPGLRHSCR